MKFKKICLFGSTGLLGSEFKEIFETQNFEFIAPISSEINLENFEKTLGFLEQEKPDLIVHCVAFTDVDLAETEQKKCRKLNVEILGSILKTKIPIIHFSTDYVFKAPENLEIPENFPKNPINFYGQTKLEAEQLLENSDINFWNIRTSWLFGTFGGNFINTILNLSKIKNELKIVDDQIGRPTNAKDLAEFVIENFIKKSQPTGHFHLQNSGNPVSWANFAEYFLKESGWDGVIKYISSNQFPTSAKRPNNSVLKNTKIPENLRNWKESVDEFLKDL